MAEKKFFVDINLQGSALTNAKIGTNSGIGSTEGAFGYDSTSHRLQYFNGTATKDVANLSDISAVTGGLIFQGGYDPTTNTPDIADGSALKGFFWAATSAGTFLGESVQVGDSIVAKVDNAGATIADWLILQGNVVIATDTVDGISRLATQAEADAGTEAGAVVITPATLQGKIDAQITPEISNKLPLAGGTMSGNIDMGSNLLTNVDSINVDNIQATTGTGNVLVHANLNFNTNKTIINLPDPSSNGDAANKLYVDDNTSNKLPLAGGTMSGNIIMDGNYIAQASIVGSEEIQTDKLSVNIGANIELFNDLNAKNSAKIVNLPAPTNGGDATNKTYVDGEVATALPLAGGTMSGNINLAGHNIDNANNITASNTTSGTIITNNLYDLDAGSISFGSNLNGDNAQTIINLPAPTNGGDAANKTYVDTTAATAESNANSYTDTKVSQLSYSAEVESSAWTLVDGVYETVVTHDLGTGFILANTHYMGYFVEFDMQKTSLNELKLYSNSLPVNIVVVTIVRADGTAPL